MRYIQSSNKPDKKKRPSYSVAWVPLKKIYGLTDEALDEINVEIIYCVNYNPLFITNRMSYMMVNKLCRSLHLNF